MSESPVRPELRGVCDTRHVKNHHSLAINRWPMRFLCTRRNDPRRSKQHFVNPGHPFAQHQSIATCLRLYFHRRLHNVIHDYRDPTRNSNVRAIYIHFVLATVSSVGHDRIRPVYTQMSTTFDQNTNAFSRFNCVL